MDADTQAPEKATEETNQGEPEHPQTIQEQVEALVAESKANKAAKANLISESLVKDTPIKSTFRIVTPGDPNVNFKWVVPKGHNLNANCSNCFHCVQSGKKYYCRLDPVANMMAETYCCSRHPQYKNVELKPLTPETAPARKKPGPKPKTAAK